MALAPVTMIVVYVSHRMGGEWIHKKNWFEIAALILLGFSTLVFLLRTWLTRQEFLALATGLNVAFFCREWHFPGTSKGVYVALVILGIWAFKRRQRLQPAWSLPVVRIWTIVTLFTYGFSQAIARRLFRELGVPCEAQLHVPWEETVEVLAHTLMVITSLIFWRVFKPQAQTDPLSSPK